MKPFDNEAYLYAQVQAFEKRLSLSEEVGRVYIEFGGKPIDDQHAVRVLPGYHPDVKLELLEHLQINASTAVVVAVSARDLLRPRIRGDTQLFYDHETIALVQHLRSRGLSVDAGVVTVVERECSAEDRDCLDAFMDLAIHELGLEFVEYPKIPNYPNLYSHEEWEVWNTSKRLEVPERRHVLVLSPGGGSGKFGVCMAELYRDWVMGVNSTYVKFETFPVFDLPHDHPINRAFVAATADLGNTVMPERLSGRTCYDKDVGNFELLLRIHRQYCPSSVENPITAFRSPSDMSVNRLTAGFVDSVAIEEAAEREIVRRELRYQDEIVRGIESTGTLAHLRRYA